MSGGGRISIEAMERRPHIKLDFLTARTADGALWKRDYEMYKYGGDKYLQDDFWERIEERET